MKWLNYSVNNTEEEQNPEESSVQTPTEDTSAQSDSTIRRPRPRPAYK
jgi:hypothetical protein